MLAGSLMCESNTQEGYNTLRYVGDVRKSPRIIETKNISIF